MSRTLGRAFLAVALAPLVLLTAGGLAELPWTSADGVPVMLALLVLYLVGSADDLVTVAWILTRRGTVRIEVHGSRVAVDAATPPIA